MVWLASNHAPWGPLNNGASPLHGTQTISAVGDNATRDRRTRLLPDCSAACVSTGDACMLLVAPQNCMLRPKGACEGSEFVTWAGVVCFVPSTGARGGDGRGTPIPILSSVGNWHPYRSLYDSWCWFCLVLRQAWRASDDRDTWSTGRGAPTSLSIRPVSGGGFRTVTWCDLAFGPRRDVRPDSTINENGNVLVFVV